MVEKSIEVTVKPDGTISIEANGYSGTECIKATEGIERALGISKGAARARLMKADVYASQDEREEAKQKW